jgi:hypothetical protein
MPTATAVRSGAARETWAPSPDPVAEDLTVRRGRPAAPAPRVRQLPPELGVDEETMLRPAVAAGASAPVSVVRDEPRRGAGRAYLAIGAGIAVAAAVVAGLLVSRHPGGQSQGQGPGQPSVTDSTDSALGPDATGPGVPVITATELKAGQVRFTWTYASPQAGDTFVWQRKSGGSGQAGGRLRKAVLSLRTSSTVCITVQVVRADGEASGFSDVACGK